MAIVSHVSTCPIDKAIIYCWGWGARKCFNLLNGDITLQHSSIPPFPRADGEGNVDAGAAEVQFLLLTNPSLDVSQGVWGCCVAAAAPHHFLEHSAGCVSAFVPALSKGLHQGCWETLGTHHFYRWRPKGPGLIATRLSAAGVEPFMSPDVREGKRWAITAPSKSFSVQQQHTQNTWVQDCLEQMEAGWALQPAWLWYKKLQGFVEWSLFSLAINKLLGLLLEHIFSSAFFPNQL